MSCLEVIFMTNKRECKKKEKLTEREILKNEVKKKKNDPQNGALSFNAISRRLKISSYKIRKAYKRTGGGQVSFEESYKLPPKILSLDIEHTWVQINPELFNKVYVPKFRLLNELYVFILRIFCYSLYLYSRNKEMGIHSFSLQPWEISILGKNEVDCYIVKDILSGNINRMINPSRNCTINNLLRNNAGILANCGISCEFSSNCSGPVLDICINSGILESKVLFNSPREKLKKDFKHFNIVTGLLINDPLDLIMICNRRAYKNKSFLIIKLDNKVGVSIKYNPKIRSRFVENPDKRKATLCHIQIENEIISSNNRLLLTINPETEVSTLKKAGVEIFLPKKILKVTTEKLMESYEQDIHILYSLSVIFGDYRSNTEKQRRFNLAEINSFMWGIHKLIEKDYSIKLPDLTESNINELYSGYEWREFRNSQSQNARMSDIEPQNIYEYVYNIPEKNKDTIVKKEILKRLKRIFNANLS